MSTQQTALDTYLQRLPWIKRWMICWRSSTATTREGAVMDTLPKLSPAPSLKRPRRETAPTQGEQAKKIPTDVPLAKIWPIIKQLLAVLGPSEPPVFDLFKHNLA
jgi:hypothetical protein